MSAVIINVYHVYVLYVEKQNPFACLGRLLMAGVSVKGKVKGFISGIKLFYV